MKAKCAICGKWITLVHQTKTNPIGRLRQHKFGLRHCYGYPLPATVKPAR